MENTGRAEAQDGPAPDDTLKAIRRDFPYFRIWREITGDRTRYIARRQQGAVPGPHTVVTADLAELRSALASGTGHEHDDPAPPCLPAPSIARIYDYVLGGKEHYAADREAAHSILADFPEVGQAARANRTFVTRAVRYTATHGISQYIDIGAGLPTSPAVHEIAQQANPAARVAYVDNDPQVLACARALLARGPAVTVVPGDMRDPAAILTHPDLQMLLNLNQPACILLASVLHFLLPADADATVAACRAAMAPGSYLIVSAGTSTGTSPALLDRLRSAYANTSDITARTAEDIAAWLTGLELIPPGLVDVQAWHPGSRHHWLTPHTARILAAVARKPVRDASTIPPALPKRARQATASPPAAGRRPATEEPRVQPPAR
jgi:O-methyltransferase involved in polyketide biosynthesis